MILNTDHGVVLFFTGDGTTSSSGTVYNKYGNAILPSTLVNVYQSGLPFNVGRAGKLCLWVKMKQHTATSITIKIATQRSDKNNPNLWGPSLVQLVAEDDGSSSHAALQGAEIQITKANIGADTEFNTVIQTASAVLSGDTIAYVKANASGLNAADYVIIGVDAG